MIGVHEEELEDLGEKGVKGATSRYVDGGKRWDGSCPLFSQACHLPFVHLRLFSVLYICCDSQNVFLSLNETLGLPLIGSSPRI
jgi:hypothetical protein